MNDNPLRAEAFRLMAAGYSVIPIGNDKRPRISSWKQYQEKAADEDQILQWWEMWPNANIGIVTGKVSGVTVIDIDAYKLGAISPDTFPPTLTIATGNGGTHLYYKYAPGLTISAGAYPQYPHLDMRNDGGFVVAPPSVTSYEKDGKIQGGTYAISRNIPLAEFPSQMFPSSKPKKTLADTVGAGEGGRNDNLASIIGQLLLAQPEKKWHSDVLPAIEKINATYKPPLPHDELLATFNSIVGRERAKRVQESGGDDQDEEENALRASFIKNKAEGTYRIAQYIVSKYDVITIGEKEREIYVYQSGMYILAENEIIFPEIQRILGPLVTKSAKMETYHKICDMTMHPRSVFASASLDLIPLKNGVYDRMARTLLPHDPAYRFTFQFPIIFDPNATCPRTSDFFDQVLETEQRAVVEEWMGYYFLRNYQFKKAIIFVGDGDTGKTTLLEVIDYLLGKSNISAVSLQKMTGDKFAAAHMFEKHGNLVDELSAKDISDTGNFKIATGNGSISGEYKFGNQFSFNNFSKLTFACNRIPDVKDFDDDAYFNRWMVIRFEQTIENKIPNFIKTLTTEEERSGLFNLAMRGLDRLLEQGKFSYGKDAMDTKREMMRSGSSIAMFAAEAISQDLGAEMTKEDLYGAYMNFCAENELSAETMSMLGKKLPFYVTYIAEGLVGVSGGKRQRGWRNVSIKVSDDDQSPLMSEFEEAKIV
jgi:putative DNA primase/helicase